MITPFMQSVKLRATWPNEGLSGFGVIPAMCTARLLMVIRNRSARVQRVSYYPAASSNTRTVRVPRTIPECHENMDTWASSGGRAPASG